MEEEKKEEIKKMEKKTLGIKAGEDTTAKWKGYCDAIRDKVGVKNQEEALCELLKLADVEKMKERVPGRQDDIDDFRTMLNQLLTKYLSCVDAFSMAREKAVEDVKLELETRSRTISELQHQQDELKKRIDELEKGLDAATTENNQLQIEIKKLNEAIADKDALVQSLKNYAAAVDAIGAIAELKELVASMKKESEPEAADIKEKNDN